MGFIMLNIFITIVCEAFKEVRDEIRHESSELNLFEYFSAKFNALWNTYFVGRRDTDLYRYVESDNYATKFPKNVDKLVENFSRVKYSFKIIKILQFFITKIKIFFS